MACSAAAADLNAPVNTQPTLLTEMQRGYRAAGPCEITLAPLDYSTCIFDISGREAARIATPDPFDIGIYLAAWTRLDEHMQADASLPDNSYAAADLSGARSGAASFFVVVRNLQKKLGLTDAQVWRAADALHVEPMARRWAYWLAQPADEIAAH
jgi:hypothetical protein